MGVRLVLYDRVPAPDVLEGRARHPGLALLHRCGVQRAGPALGLQRGRRGRRQGSPARFSKNPSTKGSRASTTRVIAALTAATVYEPRPAAMPIAALTQIVAAVVRPWTFSPLRRIAPAPRKPMPVTT